MTYSWRSGALQPSHLHCTAPNQHLREPAFMNKVYLYMCLNARLHPQTRLHGLELIGCRESQGWLGTAGIAIQRTIPCAHLNAVLDPNLLLDIADTVLD